MSSAILTLEELATYLKLPAETIRDQADRDNHPRRRRSKGPSRQYPSKDFAAGVPPYVIV
jgi:hypothetical protein